MFFNLILVGQKLNGPTRRENKGFRGRIRTIAVISDSEESEAFSRKKNSSPSTSGEKNVLGVAGITGRHLVKKLAGVAGIRRRNFAAS